MTRCHFSRADARGTALLALLFGLSLLGLAAAALVQVGQVQRQRNAEAELMAIGTEFRQALRSWHESAPAGTAPRGPDRIEDLLLDPRQARPVRHLRRLPPDPITGRNDWVLLRTRDGALAGLHSASARKPVRQTNFPTDYFHFERKTRYQDWWFAWGIICTADGCRLDDRATSP